jgi:hypothetical protein
VLAGLSVDGASRTRTGDLPGCDWANVRPRWRPFAKTTSLQGFSRMRPNPSDPERTVSVAIVATRLQSERLGKLRPEPGPRRIGTRLRLGRDQRRRHAPRGTRGRWRLQSRPTDVPVHGTPGRHRTNPRHPVNNTLHRRQQRSQASVSSLARTRGLHGRAASPSWARQLG